MAKKQTRRSISVSRTTYERLKAFCEANNISMSQLVETRVNDFLTNEGGTTVVPTMPRPMVDRPERPVSSPMPARPPVPPIKPMGSASDLRPVPAPQPVPMTSAAARFAVEPPPPIIKPKQPDTNAPKPAEKRPDQIFTF